MNSERNTQIHAYASGDMNAVETEAFERALESDEALRREVRECRETLETARQWLQSDPPGIERVEALAIPQAAAGEADPYHRSRRRAARVVSLRHVLTRMTAAAAIFVGGVFVGAWMPNQNVADPTESVVFEPSQEREVTIMASWAPIQPPRETQALELARAEAKAPPARTQTRTFQNAEGRMIIEKVSESAGRYSVWHVDNGFQM